MLFPLRFNDTNYPHIANPEAIYSIPVPFSSLNLFMYIDKIL